MAGVFTNTVFGYLRAYILIAVAVAAGGTAGGWDQTELVTFAFLTQGMINVSQAFGDPELADRVRSGDVVVDLYRPVDLQMWWLAASLGRAAFTTLARGVPPIVLGAVVFDIRLVSTPLLIAAAAASVVMASVVGFAFRFIVNVTTFWLLDNRGVDAIATMTVSFFGGLLLPIVLFPSWLEQVARLLPLATMVQFPAEVMMGVHTATGVVQILALQVMWAVVLLGIGRRLLAAAGRKVVLQGG
ncbi:MAG: ABC transporter permease [Acidimicrobiales bacterium]